MEEKQVSQVTPDTEPAESRDKAEEKTPPQGEAPPEPPTPNSKKAEKPRMEEKIANLVAEVERLKSAFEAKEKEEKLRRLESKIQKMEKEISGKLEAASTEKEKFKGETLEFADQAGRQLEVLTRDIDAIMSTISSKSTEQTFNPASVPPVVLQEAYEAVSSDIFRRILLVHGTIAVDKIKSIVESIRMSSSGMEFFQIVDDKRISISGLAGAIKKKLISARQIQITFEQFLTMLEAEVPGYKPLSLIDLIESGSRAYSVSTSTKILEQADRMEQEISNFNSRLKAVQEDLKDIRDKLTGLDNKMETLEEFLEELKKGAKKAKKGGDEKKGD